MAKFTAFFGFDLEADKIEIEIENFFDLDDIFGADKFVVIVNHHAERRIFADRFDVKDVVSVVDDGASESKTKDFEVVGVNYERGNVGDGAAGLDAEDGGADELGIIN